MREYPCGLHVRERIPKGIQCSIQSRYTTRSTRARVLTRIRSRMFMPYDASIRAVVKSISPSRVRIRPTGNHCDKVHIRQ